MAELPVLRILLVLPHAQTYTATHTRPTTEGKFCCQSGLFCTFGRSDRTQSVTGRAQPRTGRSILRLQRILMYFWEGPRDHKVLLGGHDHAREGQFCGYRGLKVEGKPQLLLGAGLQPPPSLPSLSLLPMCVHSKRPRVYVQNVPVCTGTTRTCASARATQHHTETETERHRERRQRKREKRRRKRRDKTRKDNRRQDERKEDKTGEEKGEE